MLTLLNMLLAGGARFARAFLIVEGLIGLSAGVFAASLPHNAHQPVLSFIVAGLAVMVITVIPVAVVVGLFCLAFSGK